MTHVVTEPCIRCRYTECVTNCPVDCFHAGPRFVVIDPERCIDCALCVPACPVGAIRHADELLGTERDFLALNAGFARIWPALTHPLPPPADADHWREVADKRHWLTPEAGPLPG